MKEVLVFRFDKEDERDNRMRAVDGMQDLILDALGPRAAFDELCKALSYYAKEDLFKYIIKNHDLKGGY